MKKSKILFPILTLLCSLNTHLVGQSVLQPEPQLTGKIETLDDLSAAIKSSSFNQVLMAMESWLPNLVSSLRWETRMSRRYMLHYYIDVHDEDDVLFDSFLKESEKIYEQLEKFFHIEANSKQETLALQTKLLCFIIKTRTKRTFGSMIDTHTLFYYMDTKQDPKYMEKFRHEYAHWVWGRMYGEAPSLFQEGLAVYAEKMSSQEADISVFLDKKLDLEAIPPLHEIAINENFWKHKGMYTVGSLLIYFLVEKWDWEPLKRLFLLSDYEDYDIFKHFNQVYGQSLEAVDVEWRQFLKSEVIGKN